MGNRSRFYTILIWLTLLGSSFIPASGQVFPVQVNTQLVPPYTPYLSDYTIAGSQRLMIQLRPNDVNLSDYNVKLRITIEGVGITIRTKPTMVARPITLQGGGIPLILYGEDMLEYFDPGNLDFSGITRTQYQKTGKLPEGVYRFSIEALDFNRNTLVSNKGMTVAWMILNDPPLLNLPRNDTKIRILDPVNIPFTWTPRHTGSPNAAFSTEYIFRMVEIWPANRNPYDAFLSQPVLYEVITTQSQIVYGPAEPAMIPGRKYAWQVQALDTDGHDLFKNQGRSEVYVFQYGDALGVPENFRKETANASNISVRWEPSPVGEMPDQYRIRYKAVRSDKWREVVTNQSWTTLTQLQGNTSYEIQVRGEKERRFGEYTVALRTNTAEANIDSVFSCGQPGNIPPPQVVPKLLTLTPGDVFTCADFSVVVSEIKVAKNGVYSGIGRMKINILNRANVEVEFSGTIDSTYRMVTGGVKSSYQKGSQVAIMVDQMKKIGEEKKEDPAPQADTTKAKRSITYVVPGVIDSVYVNPDGKIEVIDEEGNKTTYEPKKDPKTNEVQETVIADAGGNTYTVGKNGEVTKTSGSLASKGNEAVPQNEFEKIIKNILGQIKSSNTKAVDSVRSLRGNILQDLERAITDGGFSTERYLITGERDQFITEGFSRLFSARPQKSAEARNVDQEIFAIEDTYVDLFESDVLIVKKLTIAGSVEEYERALFASLVKELEQVLNNQSSEVKEILNNDALKKEQFIRETIENKLEM
jgi:hypothetical protein